ncbi:MAG: substrate-specific activator of APC-dependent proteolysis [Phylliscum demangeonii]|nr:MAG: substrate-specific activator of APC-dependent proteolysis [Phylliscum demangeonii]
MASTSTGSFELDSRAEPSQEPVPPLSSITNANITPPSKNATTMAANVNHAGENKGPGSRARAGSVDPAALSKALSEFKDAGRPRQASPVSSPSRKRQRVYGDRFIPNREGQDLQASFSLLHEDGSPATPSKAKKRTPHGELHFQRTEEANRTFSTLLRSEIFESTIPQVTPPHHSPDSASGHGHDGRARTPPNHYSSSSRPASFTPSTPHKNLFSYMSPRSHVNLAGHPTPSRTPHSRHGGINLDTRAEIYSLSPVRLSSQRMLLSPRKAPRAVSKVPYKVLDAPELADDFYLNLVDWGSSNMLAVGLASSVFMWNSQSGRVTKLCELQGDTVTSVNWMQRGSHLSIGTNKGYVQIWDAERCRRLRIMTGHTARVGALAWNDHILTSGSRDRLIYHRDVRSPQQYLRKLAGHKQEVCGLRWNSDDGQLASGGNDNKLMVWDHKFVHEQQPQPLFKFSEHTAAVKAIAWSPHQHHLLASGGGTADRRIKFWNTATGAAIHEVDTGSQVCNLAWSRNSNEIVSTHGYSQNQIVLWKYPSMTQVVSLTGHTFRVLYLAMSPDGQVIVTGAGDETLRFWNCFRKKGAAAGPTGPGAPDRAEPGLWGAGSGGGYGGGGGGGGGIGGRLDGWGQIR